MFVELVSWTVGEDRRENSLNLLSLLHHHMDASGGLVRALAGSELGTDSHLVSLTFWKSWEDLSRFLSSSRSSLLSEAGAGRPGEGLKPHHLEIVWEWPEDEVDTVSSEGFWVIHSYHAPENGIESLLDELRQFVPVLGHQEGFRSGGVWMDKNNKAHVTLATQWLDRSPAHIDFPEALKPGSSAVSDCRQTVFKLRLSDPHHLGVS